MSSDGPENSWTFQYLFGDEEPLERWCTSSDEERARTSRPARRQTSPRRGARQTAEDRARTSPRPARPPREASVEASPAPSDDEVGGHVRLAQEAMARAYEEMRRRVARSRGAARSSRASAQARREAGARDGVQTEAAGREGLGAAGSAQRGVPQRARLKARASQTELVCSDGAAQTELARSEGAAQTELARSESAVQTDATEQVKRKARAAQTEIARREGTSQTDAPDQVRRKGRAAQTEIARSEGVAQTEVALCDGTSQTEVARSEGSVQTAAPQGTSLWPHHASTQTTTEQRTCGVQHRPAIRAAGVQTARELAVSRAVGSQASMPQRPAAAQTDMVWDEVIASLSAASSESARAWARVEELESELAKARRSAQQRAAEASGARALLARTEQRNAEEL